MRHLKIPNDTGRNRLTVSKAKRGYRVLKCKLKTVGKALNGQNIDERAEKSDKGQKRWDDNGYYVKQNGGTPL